MKATCKEHRIAILGLGAVGRNVLERLRSEIAPHAEYSIFEKSPRTPEEVATPSIEYFCHIQELLAWKPTLAVECAGHAVVQTLVPVLLSAGVDVLLISIGALVDADIREKLANAELDGGSRLLTVSGAIGGLDALQAARCAGLHSVRYIGRKPPHAWSGTPAENWFDLSAITSPTNIFEGNASEGAALFPKNANVTAAIALAGVGFEATTVQLIADPQVTQNIHELDVTGEFGNFHIRLKNQPLPDNPKTSWLAALSIQAELKRYFLHSSRKTAAYA